MSCCHGESAIYNANKLYVLDLYLFGYTKIDTIDCVTLPSEFRIKSIMHPPEANLLAEESTFESRR